MKKRILALVVGLWASLGFLSCGGGTSSGPPSKLSERVLASQSVTAGLTTGGVYILNGENDTIPRIAPIGAGSNPGLMAISPTRNFVAVFDASSNTVYGINPAKETSLGNVRLGGSTSSLIVPTASPIAYAAVPAATLSGFAFQGAVGVMNFTTGSQTSIAVAQAQTVVSNSTATQLLVFSNDSDSVTVLTPGLAVPPVDLSCYTNPPNSVCTIVGGFSRPVYAVISGSTAYVLNCGLQCGGSQPASVAVFDLGSLTITSTIPVDAATMAVLSGTTLFVAGTSPSTTNNTCAGQTTAATICGRLDVVDLGSGTVTASTVITDGYHDRMDLTSGGQIFVGSHGCTNIGNVNNPSGEVRGCLSIYSITDKTVVVPPDNGDVTGLQGFTSRAVEYVAEGGALRVYDTTKDILLITDFLPEGTINIVGEIKDVKAIDFF